LLVLKEVVDVISAMSLPPRQRNEQQQAFLRQATILRKNLNAWEATICSARGEDWPSMLGRLNAAFVSIFIFDMVCIKAYTESQTDQFSTVDCNCAKILLLTTLFQLRIKLAI
jgi:hypothetical protein